MKPAKVRELFERFKALNPKPVTELEFSTPFELLVAVILSAQATDKGVNLATRKLFPVANTPQALLALGPEEIVLVAAPGEKSAWLDPSWLEGKALVAGAPAAYVCRGFECSLPVTEPERIAALAAAASE